MGQSWEKAAMEKGRELAGSRVPGVVREGMAEVALEGAKAALEALDLDTLALLKAALEPMEYQTADILKAVVSVIPEPAKVGH